MAEILQATEHFSVQLGKVPAVVSPGDLYYSDDPVVKGREHLFQAVEVRRSATAKKTTRATETATAAPGEKRRMASVGTTKDNGEV